LANFTLTKNPQSVIIAGNELWAVNSNFVDTEIQKWDLNNRTTIETEPLLVPMGQLFLWEERIVCSNVDTVTVWKIVNWRKETHHKFSQFVQNQIKTILVLALKSPTSMIPLYPDALFYALPKDILYIIFNWIVF